jgi:hypothetical protein
VSTQEIRLKVLVQQRHWQTHKTFCTEYDKAARTVDRSLVGSAPSRPQLHRWLSGALVKLPHPYHCRVLEAMFPGWSVQQLFEPYSPSDTQPVDAMDIQDAQGNDLAGRVGATSMDCEPDQDQQTSGMELVPWFHDRLNEGLEAVRAIQDEYAGTMAVDLFHKVVDDCLRQLRDLRRGYFEAPFDDNWLVYALTERTQSNLLATSVEEVDLTWWHSAAGHTYWRLHKEALGRGVRIQRIFVYRHWTDTYYGSRTS